MVHLEGREELGLVDEHAVKNLMQGRRLSRYAALIADGPLTAQDPPVHQGTQVVVGVDEEVDAARHPEPGDDRVLTLGIDHCLEE